MKIAEILRDSNGHQDMHVLNTVFASVGKSLALWGLLWIVKTLTESLSAKMRRAT